MEVTETTNELVKVVETSGVEPQTATTLKESFLPFFEQAEEWKRKAEALVVTDATQVHDMKMARTARLALKEIRVNADKKRKELKEDSLRYGKAVQGVYNVIEFLIAPIEKHLQEQEDFVAIAEAERKARKEAEAKVIAEQKAKALLEKKAKAAPDKAKLNDFAKMLDELTLPELKSEEANKVLSDAKTLLQKVSTFIREKSSII